MKLPILTLCASLTLAACASAPSRVEPGLSGSQASANLTPRTLSSAAAAPAAQPGGSDQRNRQFQHAEALYLSGHLKEAAAAFEELSRAYPRDARVWLKYGNTLTKLDNYDEASAAFQNAVQLDAGQGNAALNLGLVRLLQAQGSLDVALARLPAESPEHVQAESLRRQIQALLGPSERGASTH